MTIGQAFECELNKELDMIKAEIEEHRRKTQSIDPYDLVGDCLDIIDKYKVESIKRVRMSREQLKAINDFWKEYTGRELYKNED